MATKLAVRRSLRSVHLRPDSLLRPAMLHWHRLQKLRPISFADSAMGWLSLTEQAAEVRNPGMAQGDLPGFICQHPCFSIAWIHHVDPCEVANKGL